MRLGSGTFAACCVVIEVLGVALFLRGFFPAPVCSFSGTEHQTESPAPEPSAGAISNWTKLPPPLFGKVVIMLIDALRDDFVFGSKGVKFMPYTTYLVEKGSSHSFVAEAKPPTVTMPRIKERETLLPNLLVLCGDHGMSEAGGHGASSVQEVNTALILISSAFERKPGDIRRPKYIQQTDLAATLSIGLGLPIPKSNIGSLIFPVVEGKPMREQLRFLHLNTVQLSKLLQENVPSYKKEPAFEQFKVSERLHGTWVRLYLEGNSSEALSNLGSKVRRQYLDALRALSLSLSRQAAQYDIYSMAVGTVLVLEVLVLLLLSGPQALSGKAELDVPLPSPAFSLLCYLLPLGLAALHVTVCTSAGGACYLCSLPWLTAGGLMVLVSTLLCAVLSALTGMFAGGKRLSKNPPQCNSRWSELDLLILLGTVGHMLSLGASSFIEEEPQTWYFLVNTLCLALCHEIYRNCFLGDDCAPQRCPHAGEDFDGVAVAPQGKSPGPDVWELDRASKHPSPVGALRGPERWMVLASPWLILTCCRLLRSLNQTGVQWAHRPDLGHWLTSSDHKAELSVLAAVSLIMIFVLVQKRCSLASKVAMAFGLLGIYCYRVAIGNLLFPWQQNNKDISKGITEARFVYVFVLGILFTGTKGLLKSQITADDFTVKTVGLWEIYSGLVLLAALLLRPHNLPVLALSLVIQTIMTQFIWRPLRHDAAEVTVMHYWFGQAFFYFQGNSNSIATVDISAGFVGLDAYVEIPAMLLTTFATYTGPVLWASHLVNFLTSEASSGSALSHACFCYALICSIPVCAYIIFVTSLRYHLFIWSVFSPKLLYEGMHLLITAAVCVFFTAMDQTNTKS
ncbi:PREDICTED: GPI ethanolamine phosphate transferase 2 isoform X3 [Lipotes vexillifer]|uniref:GPI ethanolamine phosphate transferase 2 isoform X3 n=1 Tax=Lipotes vexillifer TaxID=118797 RepID=A0A340Y6G4_LIPVE|nr:PREDICTED: GPI ethanolamine phosphate transferase 2 isoform X3 [Lipotes vexillifer]